MARRRNNNNEGLLNIAIRSDWKVSAGMAGACLLAGAVVIPVVVGQNPLLRSLVTVLSPLAWLLGKL